MARAAPDVGLLVNNAGIAAGRAPLDSTRPRSRATVDALTRMVKGSLAEDPRTSYDRLAQITATAQAAHDVV